jgi:hypothetical protein
MGSLRPALKASRTIEFGSGPALSQFDFGSLNSLGGIAERNSILRAVACEVEAELTVDVAARREALVKALFLDPLSQRLKTMPEAELAIATRTLHEPGNPFARRAESANQMIRDRSPIASLESSGRSIGRWR